MRVSELVARLGLLAYGPMGHDGNPQEPGNGDAAKAIILPPSVQLALQPRCWLIDDEQQTLH